MSYYAMGATGGIESRWCSTDNPQGNCSPIRNICKPMDAATLKLFKDLQTQLNRIAHVKGYKKIDVDGRIGPGTVSLYNKAIGTTYATCDQLASITVVGASIAAAKSVAATVGAPATVPMPVAKKPSIALPDGTVQHPPMSITDDLFGMVTSPAGLVVAGGLGFLAYRMATGGKKGGRRRAPARRRAARRRPARRRATRRRRR